VVGNNPTDRLLAYLLSSEGAQGVAELVADIGGDPEQYGIDDLASLSARTFVPALKQGLEFMAHSGLVRAEITALIGSEEINWQAIGKQLDAILISAFASMRNAPDAQPTTPAVESAAPARPVARPVLHEPLARTGRELAAEARGTLLGHLRAAARAAAPDWRRASTGLVYRTPDGYGQIVMSAPWRQPDGTISVQLTAGSASKYLLGSFNRQPTNRAPSQDFVGIHAKVLPPYEIRYGPAQHPTPEPFSPPPALGLSAMPTADVLTADTAQQWFVGLLEQTTPVVERTSTDDGLLDWLINRDASIDFPNVTGMRYAVLLARHLGRPYQALLKRAEVLEQKQAERLTARGLTRTFRDRQTGNPHDWSHQRFVQFLASADR
jgi:hypothetical protein